MPTRPQEHLLGARLALAMDTTEQRRSSWALNHVRASAIDVVVPETTLRTYVGRFEEFTVELRDGRLFCVNTSRRNKTDRLVAIAPTLFEIDGESQVEFLTDASGVVSKVRLLWSDGWTDSVARTR